MRADIANTIFFLIHIIGALLLSGKSGDYVLHLSPNAASLLFKEIQISLLKKVFFLFHPSLSDSRVLP